jgi:hypothetical protein
MAEILYLFEKQTGADHLRRSVNPFKYRKLCVLFSIQRVLSTGFIDPSTWGGNLLTVNGG